MRFFLLLLSSVLFPHIAISQPKNTDWNQAPNGIAYRTIATAQGKELFVARITAGKHGIKVLRAQDFGKKAMTAREICLASGALLCINSSFFDEKDSALGLLISSGITFQKVHIGGDTLTGIFAVARKSFSIVGRDDFSGGLFIEAIQAGPRLVINSEGVTDIRTRDVAQRSGICLDQSGTPIFFRSTLDSWPISLREFSQAMLLAEVGCKDGLNLDGGGSAQLFMRTESVKAVGAKEEVFEIKGQDEAPVFLGVVVEGLR